MKRFRFVNTVISVTLALTVIAFPASFNRASAPEADAGSAAAATVTAEPCTTAEKAEITKAAEPAVEDSGDEVKDITDENISDYIDSADVFYEPKAESVTVLDDGSAYINDVVSVFFEDSADESDVERIAGRLNGEVVGSSSWMNEVEIKIEKTDFAGIEKLCGEIMEDEDVEFASCSIATPVSEEYVPEDPWDGWASWDEEAENRYPSYNNWWITATHTDEAWNYMDKFSKINIGIVDSGVDANHPDLKNVVSFPDTFFELHNAPGDHGTHVAGIIGAEHNNNTCISGIVPDCNLICADWLPDKEDGQRWNSEIRIVTAFANAVKAGAKVVNFSLGSSGNIANGTTDRYQFVKDAEGRLTSYYIAKLLERGYDFICCQSAGNGTTTRANKFYAVDSTNNGTFCTVTKENAVKTVDGVTPEDIVDRIIVVAACRNLGGGKYEQCSFSNGGEHVSICAPGQSIYSTIPYEESLDTYCDYMSGTSMAAPVVTGIASLVWSVNQSFTGAQVKHFVCDNTSIEVADSSSASHLPTGTMRMVDAKLAVEAAIAASENNGTAVGKIVPFNHSGKVGITLTSDDGTVYRAVTDEDGSYSFSLPEGGYTLSINKASSDYDTHFEVTSSQETTVEEIMVKRIDTYYGEKLINAVHNMRSFLSKIGLY